MAVEQRGCVILLESTAPTGNTGRSTADLRQIVAHHQAYGVGGLEACEEEGKGGGRRWPESRGRNNPSTMRLLPIPSNYRRSDSARCRTLDDRSVVLQQRRGADHANCQEGNNQERPYRPSILLTYRPKKFQWGAPVAGVEKSVVPPTGVELRAPRFFANPQTE